MITPSPALKYFDPKLPIKASPDASVQGLGGLLEQLHENEWHPITYTSRSLSSAKTNYCPLELEILSIPFACQYFLVYIYRQDFIVHNDHKPLKSIMNKQIAKAPPRIQRFKAPNRSRTMRSLTNLGQKSVPTSPNTGENLPRCCGLLFQVFEISKLLNNTSPIVIKKMKAMSTRHGIPKLFRQWYRIHLARIQEILSKLRF